MRRPCRYFVAQFLSIQLKRTMIPPSSIAYPVWEYRLLWMEIPLALDGNTVYSGWKYIQLKRTMIPPSWTAYPVWKYRLLWMEIHPIEKGL